jgi:SagB-type dehydrogenase family enzyme
VITSRIARQREVYGELAYSLVLKEVGGLYQTLYLVAEQLGLSACALGGGTPDTVFEQITNTTEFDEPIVGEFIIGRRDPPAP